MEPALSTASHGSEIGRSRDIEGSGWERGQAGATVSVIGMPSGAFMSFGSQPVGKSHCLRFMAEEAEVQGTWLAP